MKLIFQVWRNLTKVWSIYHVKTFYWAHELHIKKRLFNTFEKWFLIHIKKRLFNTLDKWLKLSICIVDNFYHLVTREDTYNKIKFLCVQWVFLSILSQNCISIQAELLSLPNIYVNPQVFLIFWFIKCTPIMLLCNLHNNRNDLL